MKALSSYNLKTPITEMERKTKLSYKKIQRLLMKNLQMQKEMLKSYEELLIVQN